MHNDTELNESSLTEKFGFDPTDDSWIESEMAITPREKKWFHFERTNSISFYKFLNTNDWRSIVSLYNEKYKDTIEESQARDISVKRMRYILGSTITRMSGERNKKKWVTAAREFEEYHKKIEERMNAWSVARKGRFPTVTVKKPLSFFAGPYFNACIEKIPHLFTDTKCTHVKEGTILRVISFDPQTKHFKLDFQKEIRQILKKEKSDVNPWTFDGGSYVFLIGLSEFNEFMDSSESLVS